MRHRSAIVAVMALAAGILPVPGTADSSCPLPSSRQFEAVRAFAPIAKFVSKEPRCINCHGAVNPHLEETGTDPDDPNQPPSVVPHGGGRIPRLNPATGENRTMEMASCMECHDHMVPRRDGSPSRWFTAPPFLSFMNKSATELCRQFKRSTGSAEHFMGHLEDDNGGNSFARTAFAGTRGLDLQRFTDIHAEPPSLSHAAMLNLARKWIEAMDGRFVGDENCGCTYEFEGAFKQRREMSLDVPHLAAYGANVSSNYQIDGRIRWSPDTTRTPPALGEDSIVFAPVDGEITVTIDAVGKSMAGRCKYEGSKTFQIKAMPPAALRYLQLEVSKDGRYRLMLGMISRYLQFQARQGCVTPTTPGLGPEGTTIINDAAIELGRQTGTLADDGIVGRTETPIISGPLRITGEWKFEPASPQP